jgi:hypothetical protein
VGHTKKTENEKIKGGKLAKILNIQGMKPFVALLLFSVLFNAFKIDCES